MFIINLLIAGICLHGVIQEFRLPEEDQSQARLFFNVIFVGLNAYFAWLQLL
jgi:hypothetical protein